jgi:hypothetical protein
MASLLTRGQPPARALSAILEDEEMLNICDALQTST